MSSVDAPNFLAKIQRPWKFLAPMVSNSEEAYRRLARRHGADLCFTEMVHCAVFNKGKKNSRQNYWYTTDESDRPLVVQICGNDPKTMLETCLTIQDCCDAIDINFGCPQEIARKGNYGSFLQDDWDLVERIVRTLSSGIRVPLFCKIRVFESIERTVAYAKLIERSGCALLTVHGRQRHQKGHNTGLASWEHIRAVKDGLAIPVVANGNMIRFEDMERCIAYTGCDGIMIAEPHLYNPMIFTGERRRSIDVFEEYLRIIQERPRSAQCKHIKSHAFKMMCPLLAARTELRSELDRCSSLDDYLSFVNHVRILHERGEISEDALGLLPYIRSTECALM